MFDEEDLMYEEEMAPEEGSFPVEDSESEDNQAPANLNPRQNTNLRGPGNMPPNNFARNKQGNGLANSPVTDALNKNQSRNLTPPNGGTNQNNKEKENDTDEENQENNQNENSKGEDLAEQAAQKSVDVALEKLEKMGPKGKIAAEAIRKTGAKEKIGELVDKAIKKMKADKRKMILRMLAPLIPYIVSAFMVFIAIVIVMSQIMLVVEKIDETLVTVSTGVEKVVNFLSGEGWNTEEQEFFNTLNEEYEFSLHYSAEGIDIPLIAATIHYSRLTDVSIYEQDAGTLDSSINAEQDTDSLFGNFINAEQMKNFYYVANDKLGSLNSFVPGNRKLIGHMVDISLEMNTYNFSTALEKWENFFRFFFADKDLTISDFVRFFIGAPAAAYEKIRELLVYDEVNDGNADGYFKYKIRNIKYELQELRDLFASSISPDNVEYTPYEGENPPEDEDSGIWPAPNITLTINEEKYYEYLVNVYIPGTFFSDSECTGEEDENCNYDKIEEMAREIFRQRDTYRYLIGEDDESSLYAGNSISVTLTTCDGSTALETVSLYDYIKGTLYLEAGDTPLEFLKAQAVAVKTYLFAKNNVLPDTIPAMLRIKSCQQNQVFCSTDKGCHYIDDGDRPGTYDTFDTVASGPAVDSHYNLHDPLDGDPISEQNFKNNIKEATDSTLNEFIVKNGRFVYTEYRSSCTTIQCDPEANRMDQAKAIELAKEGKTYTEILQTYYSGELTTISLGGGYPLDIEYNEISSRYGWRVHPLQKVCKHHNGYDFNVPKDEPIYSVADGVVVASVTNYGLEGYGNYVIVGHGEITNGVYEYYSVYAHMVETPPVSVGQKVVGGKIIGNVGSTGASTGAHLHFEIYRIINGSKVNEDPGIFLKNYEFTYKNSSHFSTEQECLNYLN